MKMTINVNMNKDNDENIDKNKIGLDDTLQRHTTIQNALMMLMQCYVSICPTSPCQPPTVVTRPYQLCH